MSDEQHLKNSELLSSGRLTLVPSINLDHYYQRLSQHQRLSIRLKGRVKQITGMIVQARLPNARIGELCSIEPPDRPPVKAQVVGFTEDDVFLTPLDSLEAVGPKTPVINRGDVLKVGVGYQLLGRVVNSLGEPIDGKGDISTSVDYPVRRSSPEAMKRSRISSILPVGIRAIDTLFTIGEGQRVGVFSTAGVGKSSLLGMIARSSTADVNVVALVGERGREVLDFLDDSLKEDGLARSVVVVSTSDEPPLRRIMAAYTATAIAEYFRDQGKRVMLLMDSVTRFARACREIALSIGEPPARQGYPPSVFATLPELLERAGKTSRGSITAFYTVLLSSIQIEDPLGEEIRAILDGHLYLSSQLAQLRHYPAIDPLQSNSRVMDGIVSGEHAHVAKEIMKLWSAYENNRDLISIGAYRRGTDSVVDEAIDKRDSLVEFLVQPQTERTSIDEALRMARRIV